MASGPNSVTYLNPTCVLWVRIEEWTPNKHVLIKNGLRILDLLNVLGSQVDIITGRGTCMTFK